MNHVFNVIWSHQLQAFVPVPERVSSGGKQRRRRRLKNAAAVAVVVLVTSPEALAQVASNALPTGGQITAGSGSISQSGSSMTVTQNSGQMIATWNTFNIGSGASVQFVQPSTSAVALNRVLGGVSQIMGSLSANGQVYLINPNGIVFGQGAQVNVGGVVASSLNLSNADFLAGRHAFTGGDGAGAVVNQGTINAASGGVIALIAPKVSNEGTLNASGGSVALAAAGGVTLDFVGDGLLNVRVDQGTFDALVENKGVIVADGGVASMSAQSATALLDTVINNTGTVRADTLSEKNGRIVLDGGTAGTVQVSGTLSAQGTAAGQTGGAIDVTGHDVAVAADAVIDASGAAGGGTIRIGGGVQGQDATIANAQNVSVAEGAAIHADATQNGDGGSVVVWSDGVTNVGGTITARGGAVGGDGGFIETSGHQLTMGVLRVDAGASNGAAGQWLIDPTNSTIDATEAANIVSGLNTTDVTYTDTGTLTVSSNIVSTSGHSLTLTGTGADSVSGGAGVVLSAVTISVTGDLVISGNGYNVVANSVSSYGGTVNAGGTAGYGVQFSGAVNLSGTNITVTGVGGRGGNATNTAAAGPALPKTGAKGDSGSRAVAGNGVYGVLVDAGAAVNITATTAATITATGGNGGDATTSNTGGVATGGSGADGYQQDGNVTFDAPTATIDGRRGTAGNGSSTYYTEYDGGHSESYSCGQSTCWHTVYQDLTADYRTTSHSGSSGSDASYGIDIGGNLTNSTANSTLKLVSLGNARQTAGALTAKNVLMQSNTSATSWTFDFRQSGNNIDVLAAQANTLYYRDSEDLVIGTVGGVSGITTSNATYVKVDAKSAGAAAALIQNSGAIAISVGTTGVFSADTMQFNGDAGTVTGTYVGLRTNTTSRGISITGTDVDPGNTLFLDTAKLGVFASSIGSLVIGGSTNTGTITVNGASFNPNTTLSVGNGNISLAGNLSVGSGKQLTLQSSGTVDGNGTVTAPSLLLTGSGTFKLTAGKDNTSATATNSVQTLAASAGTVELINSGALTVSNLSAQTITGGTAWDSSPFSTVSANGVSGSQRVYLNTTTDLSLSAAVSSSGTYTAMNGTTPTDMNDRMGAAVVLVAGRYFNNNYNSSALSATNSRWLVYSQTPETGGNSRGNQAHTFRYYAWDFFRSADSSYNYDNGSFGRTLPGNTGSTAGLNGFLYSAQPTLTVTPDNNQSGTYGNTPSLSGYGASGWYTANGGDSGTMTGTARYSTTATSNSNVGTYDISYIASDTTTDATQYLVPKYNGYVMGYKVVNSTRTNGYTVNQRAITITADASQTKVYGDADSVLTYTVTSGSLVNTGAGGTGALSGSLNGGGVTATVGNYNITQGTLGNSNYNITYVGNTYNVVARPITITANSNQQKHKGELDPTLLYSVIYTGNSSKTALVNNDSLTGSLARAEGEENGDYAINQGTLAASANYAITFVGADFAITTPSTNTSSLVSVQTGITGTSTSSGSTTQAAQQVGAGTGTSTLVNAANNQVVFNNTTPAPAPTTGAAAPAPQAPATQTQGATPAATVPTAMTVSSGGATSAMTVSVSGGAVSVDVPALANVAADPAGNNSTGLTLFVAGGQGVQAKGDFNVVHQGTTMTATTGTATVAPPTAAPTLVGEPVVAAIDVPGLGNVPISVGVSAEGVLVISMPADAVQAADPQTTMLVGLALARQGLGTSVGDVKAVMITPAQ